MPRRSATATAAVTAAVMAFGAAAPAASETLDAAPGTIALDLNRVDASGEGCRISLVGSNGLDADVERMVLELVLFDRDGTIERFMRIAIPAIGSGGLRAVQFDIDSQPCDAFSRVLINDVVECAGPQDSHVCAEALRPSSRTNIAFISSGPVQTAPVEATTPVEDQ